MLANIDEGHDPKLHRSLSRVKATLDGLGLMVHKLRLPYQPFCMPDEMLLALQKEGFKHYFEECSDFLPGSYVNYYIANQQAVIVPLFNQRDWDKLVLHTLKEVFRGLGRKVVGVPTQDLLVGGGMQHPLPHPAGATTLPPL